MFHFLMENNYLLFQFDMRRSSLDYNAKYDDTSTIEEVIELPAELKERVKQSVTGLL